jgi:restriction endonuclease Mrr
MLLIENYISADLLKKDTISIVERLNQHINLVDANELNQLLNTYKQFIKTNKIASLDFLDEKIKGIE